LNPDFESQLQIERVRLAVLTKGGIAAPLAGAIYWFALFILGLYVSERAWCLIAFITSGLIFPLALLLQKPTGSNIMVKNSPIAEAGLAGFINMAVGWAVTIAAFSTNPTLVPLTLAIGMSLHFSTIGWSFGVRSLMVHPLLRAAVVTALWYAYPQYRFTAIPLAVAFVYLATIPFLLREVAAAHKALNVNAAAYTD
jgi:hypothetical protein